MSNASIAVVTGANRGIGKEICRQLKAKGCHVILTARNRVAGEEAATELGVEFRQLDVLSNQSVEQFESWLRQTHRRLDILVNNAAILADQDDRLAITRPGLLEEVLATNTFAPIRLIRCLLPLLKCSAHPRIVNMSSRLAQMSALGPGTPIYRISKVSLNAATAILAAELADTPIKINAASPGWVATDMGGPNAPQTIAEGADTPMWLAMLPDDGPTGGYFENRKRLDW
jgi:NAD(P)-dependent dehydrogenase (short-subunit alcohol dehydrogenase family)